MYVLYSEEHIKPFFLLSFFFIKVYTAERRQIIKKTLRQLPNKILWIGSPFVQKYLETWHQISNK